MKLKQLALGVLVLGLLQGCSKCSQGEETLEPTDVPVQEAPVEGMGTEETMPPADGTETAPVDGAETMEGEAPPAQ